MYDCDEFCSNYPDRDVWNQPKVIFFSILFQNCVGICCGSFSSDRLPELDTNQGVLIVSGDEREIV